MRHFKTRKGSFKRKLSKFGDLITFDSADMGKPLEWEVYWDGTWATSTGQIHRNSGDGH